MKTLVVIITVAAFTAFAVLPLVLEVTASAVCIAALLGIVFSDYTRTSRRWKLPAAVPVAVVAPRKERFGLAA